MWEIRNHVVPHAPEGGAGAGGAGGQGGDTGGGAGNDPWHKGVDPAILGHWQNKSYNLTDPKVIAIEATKAAIEAQKFVGVPPEQLIRLPKDAADEAGWKGVYSRLGVPGEGKDYDFAGIKFTDGTELDAAFGDMMRGALLNARVPKDRAGDVVKAVVKFMEDSDARDTADAKALREQQVAALKKSWGQNQRQNELHALEATRRLGMTQAEYDAIADKIGYDRAGEIFRKIGAGTTEDMFVEGNKRGGDAPPATREAAAARLEELKRDGAWVKRLFAGDSEAVREHKRLVMQANVLTEDAA